MKKTTIYRRLIEDSKILISPGAYDCISAKVAEKEGFQSVAISGAGIANSYLGKPDVGLLTLTENISVSRNIARAVDIPVSGDADTGYGNALNVYNTVQLFEDAGLVSVNLEDQTFPKRCGHLKGKAMISIKEMGKKIEAAIAARRDPDFMIVARTDAAALEGIDEAIKRAKFYIKSGADMVFPDAVLSEEDIKKFVGEVQALVSINMGLAIRKRSTTPLMCFKDLEKFGVARVTFPRLSSASAINGFKSALGVIKESYQRGEIIERPDLAVSFEELKELMKYDEYSCLERRFMTIK